MSRVDAVATLVEMAGKSVDEVSEMLGLGLSEVELLMEGSSYEEAVDRVHARVGVGSYTELRGLASSMSDRERVLFLELVGMYVDLGASGNQKLATMKEMVKMMENHKVTSLGAYADGLRSMDSMSFLAECRGYVIKYDDMLQSRDSLRARVK